MKEGRPGGVVVMLDDEHLTVQQAAELAGVLATTVAKGSADDTTIVRTMDLPEGEDFVVFDEVDVVALSSRLTERGRQEVLSSLGLT